MQLMASWNVDSARRAALAFEKALAIDEAYAPAWAGLAWARGRLTWMVLDYPGAAEPSDPALMLEKELAAAERAVALAPENAFALTQRATAHWNNWNWNGARADIERALVLDPGSGLTHASYATILSSITGRADFGLEHLEKATELDPLNGQRWYSLGDALCYSGRFDAARQAEQRSLEIDPDNFTSLVGMAYIELWAGRPAEARIWASKVKGEHRLFLMAVIEHSLGNDAASREALAELTRKYGHLIPSDVAFAHAWRGERDAAFEWLERAVVQRDHGLIWVRKDRMLLPLHSDPRWKALLKKMNLPED